MDLKATVEKLKISVNEALLESSSLQLNHPFGDAHEAALKFQDTMKASVVELVSLK